MKSVFHLVFITVLLFTLAISAAFGQTPVVSPGGVLNAASNDKTGQPVALGSLVSIYGTDLTAATASAGSIPLSTVLSGVSVTFNGVPAPMLNTVRALGYDQLNVQVPWEAVAIAPPNSTAVVQMVVARNGVPSAPTSVLVSPTAPGIFTFGFGPGQAVAYGNLDGAIAAPTGAALPFPSHPAKIGDPNTLVILATGLGPVDNPVPNGDIPPPTRLSQTLTKPTVLVGGIPAQVVFSGLIAYVGVYQINIIIAPGTPVGNAVPLQILMNGITTRNDVTIAVSQ